MKHRTHFRIARRDEFGNRVVPGTLRHFVSPIISALGYAGSEAASIAAPAITGAATGALAGALTHGNIGEDALIGGVGGGALGYATAGAGNAAGTGLYNDAAGALSSAFGSGGGGLPAGIQTITGANGQTIYTDASGTPLTAGQQFAASGEDGPFSAANPSGTAASGSLPSSTTGQAANIAGTGGGLFGGKPGGINNTSLALGALAAVGSALNKPKVGTWATPSPSSTAANAGPYFNAPLNTNVPGRTPVQPPANTDWYTYGQRPEQSFFSNNSLNSYGWAKGGALGQHEFSTDTGEHFVRGPGTGTSDEVPARLSDGEYVLTHADVNRIGGGNNERGAKILDHDRGALAHALGEKKFVRKPLRRAA